MPEQRDNTLDPHDWDEFRRLGHRMMDDMVDYLQTLRERPVWQPVPEEVKSQFKASLPVTGSSEAAVYEEFKQSILPYPLGNTHPRFWGCWQSY